MPFREKGSVIVKNVKGQKVEEIESETIITLTNKVTGHEYMSDEAAERDVYDPNTSTKKEDLRRDVTIDIKKMPDLFTKTGL